MLKQVFLNTLFLFSCNVNKNKTNNAPFPDNSENIGAENEISKQKQIQEYLTFYYGGTLTEIIERAERENKLVFVDFTAVWCAQCKLTEEKIYTHRSVYELYNQTFINYRNDIEKENGPDLAFLCEVKTLPAMLFLDKRGRVVLRNTGSLCITAMIYLANDALKAENSK